ncbi:DUF4328 domain-containing protein [Streptomyces sp. NPDC093970]|uniref:DUF4328 domain-containing protein n=1 Tax=Streptomyces sp. NPDC093970 TaxID=3155076 RepID=UPI00343843B3
MTSAARTNPGPLARATQAVIAVAAVVDVFRAVALRDHRLHPSDASLQRSGTVSNVFVYLMTLAIVLFLVWLARSRRTAQERSPAATLPSPGWTVGAWFVPVVNLIVPRRFVLDIGRADPSWSKRDATLVNLWWTAWIGHGLVLTVTAEVAAGSMAALVAAEALMIAAAVLVGLVIERVTATQGAGLTAPAAPLPQPDPRP